MHKKLFTSFTTTSTLRNFFGYLNNDLIVTEYGFSSVNILQLSTQIGICQPPDFITLIGMAEVSSSVISSVYNNNFISALNDSHMSTGPIKWNQEEIVLFLGN